jgi:hypothetical protein
VSKRVATPKTITITRGPFGFIILLTSRHPVNEANKKKKKVYFMAFLLRGT